MTWSNTVHPRARGERLRIANRDDIAHGSSPRARGTVLGLGVDTGFERFIPARAGNGPRRRSLTTGLTVHPRARGERWPGTADNMRTAGSSPRARGTEGRLGRGRLWRRFIPARAGNGLPGESLPDACSVHPRARGERGADRVVAVFCSVHPRARGERSIDRVT